VNISNDLNSNTLSETEFGVYPNPIHAGETLHLDFDEKINKAELINPEGKICQQYFNLDQNQVSLPTQLTSGIYIIRIESETRINYSNIFVK
jgi:hypothetical protein